MIYSGRVWVFLFSLYFKTIKMKEEFIENVLVSIQGMLSVEQIDLLVG